jgi:hypothetical protein
MTGSSVAIRHVAKSQPDIRLDPDVADFPRNGAGCLGAFFVEAFFAGAFFAEAFSAPPGCAWPLVLG